LKALSDGVDASDPHAPVRALRGLKHERLRKRLFILDKDARLRSGARGLQARKALKAFEKVVAESSARCVFLRTILRIPLLILIRDVPVLSNHWKIYPQKRCRQRFKKRQIC
jgi:hypothetical protein